MPRAAIYCRISADRDGDRLGVERQEADCRRLCEDRGWTVAGAYVDNDISAADVPGKKRLLRPEYDRLVADISADKLDAVAVWDLDRLTRRPDELEAFVTLCEKHRVTLEWLSGSVKPGGDGLLTARIKAAVAAEEVRKQRERMLRRSLQDAEKGVARRGGRRAFGWEHDGMTIRPDEAALICEAAEHILGGGSLRSISAEWNRRGIRTAYGNKWTGVIIRAMLRQPRNTGLRQHRGVVVGEAVWPAIIKRETWEKLRAILDNPARRTNFLRETARAYPLRGIISCGRCGELLISRPRNKVTRGGTLVHMREYGCKRETGCHKTFVNADHVETLVFSRVLPLLDDPYVRSLAAGERAAQHEKVQALLLENAQDEQARSELATDYYQHRVIDRTMFVRQEAALRHRVEERQQRIAALRGHSALSRFDGPIATHWDELTVDEQRVIVKSIVADIVISPPARGGRFGPERVHIHWRWDALAEYAERKWDATSELERKRAERQAHVETDRLVRETFGEPAGSCDDAGTPLSVAIRPAEDSGP